MINLFIDEFGEAFFSLNGSDIASVIAPNKNTAFDVENEERRGRTWHNSN